MKVGLIQSRRYNEKKTFEQQASEQPYSSRRSVTKGDETRRVKKKKLPQARARAGEREHKELKKKKKKKKNVATHIFGFFRLDRTAASQESRR